MKYIFRFFDRLEDRIRSRLSRVPIAYAIIGGIAVVIFWRGIWEIADDLETLGGIWSFAFNPAVSVILSIVVLLFTGLFVSFFIGDRIILSGLKHEKKVEEKTETEVREEEIMLAVINQKLDRLNTDIEEIKSSIRSR